MRPPRFGSIASAVVLMVAMFAAGPVVADPSQFGTARMALGPGSPTYSQVILADQPIIYWRLGEKGSFALDSSGNGRDARFHNGPIRGKRGAIVGDSNKAVLFDGVDDYAKWDPRHASYAGPFSVEAWVNTRTRDRHQHFFFTREPGENSFDIKLDRLIAHGVRVDVGNGTWWFVTETIPFPWKPGVWYHIVAVATLSGVTVYVNGAPIGGFGYSGTPLLFDGSHRVEIGTSYSGSSGFNGRIDEVAVYDYALTADQVAAHYAAGVGP